MPSKYDTSKTTLVSLKDIVTDSLEENSLSFFNNSADKTFTDIKDAVLKTDGEKRSDACFNRLKQGFKDYYELNDFLVQYLNLQVPYKKNCLDNHCAPFQFVGDLILGREHNCLVIGPRGGAKSYNAGLIQWLLGNMYALFDGRILGGSEDQALKSYEAMLDIWERAGIDSKNVLKDEFPRNKFTHWKTGSQIRILCASQKSVRGPHPTCLTMDEIDEMEHSILTAALQQPMSKNGIDARLIMMSTYHKISGTMARILGDSINSTDVDDISDEIATAKKFKEHMRIYRYCYDKETEVLTSSGWKFFREVLDSDKIFSLNPDTHFSEFVSFKNRISYNYSGDMVQFKSYKDDILVTPNHRMYAKATTSKKAKYKSISAEDLATKNFFGLNRYANWEGKKTKNITINGVIVNFKDFCEFMGFYISEGCLRRSNGLNIGQTMSVHPAIYSQIKDCMGRIFKGKKICTYKNTIEVYGVKWMHDYLSTFGKVFDKFIPTEIKNATKEDIRVFMDAFLLGDGRVHRVPSQFKKDKYFLQKIYYTSAPRLAADLGEMIIKLGKFPSYTPIKNMKHPHWAIRETISKASYFYSKRKNKQGMRINRVQYNDMVYCLELEKNHIMLTRRNGKCTWQGNCVFEILEPCVDYRCSTCPISHICPGPHMKEAVGYYKMSDFIQKMNTMSKYTLNAEWLCRKPSRSGLVLEGYRDEVNTLDIGYIEGLPVEMCIDFGFTKENPYAIGFIQNVENFKLHDGRVISGSILIDEIYSVPRTNAEMIAKVKAKKFYNPDKHIWGIADSAEKDLIAEWVQNGFRIYKVNKRSYTISAGLDKLNGMIKPIQGAPTFYVSTKCHGFLSEKDSYKWGPKGEPLDKDNHCVTGDSLIDTLRGEIQIKDVIVGDYVLTRGGYQKVLASMCTGVHDVWSWTIAGQEIKATDYHPVYTVNRGFVPIKDLDVSDIVLKLRSDYALEEKTVRFIPSVYPKKIQGEYLGKQKVYNLQVENYPEFICHKLLVHNSIDALRYYCISKKSGKWGEAKIV